jgi:parallel beta-helix repeat protein
MPASKYMPVEFSAIQINESKNIVISLNEVTRCHGITIKKSENITVSKCQVFSTIHGIFSDRGRNIKANYNWVEDSVKYGIFLYNGPDHEIGHNYVAWTGREGIGTNGNQCQNHYYHDNTIIHAGWTAINVEENFVKPGKLGTAKTRVENNLIVDTYYGIILMGNGVICDSNKIYYSSQDGIIIVNNPNAKNHKVKNNLIVGSAQNGIWISQKSSGHLISGNQIIQSHTAVNLEGENCKLVENRISRFMNGINSNVKQVEIVSNEIFQGRNGMSISRAQGGTKITGNHFHHVLVAMWMSDSEKVELTDNIFNNCPRLPQIRKSNNILFKKNKALYTSRGIGLRNTSDCIISENTFYSALCWFVWVEDGKNNKIEKNQIKDVLCQFNGGSAIRLKNAENNFVGSNIITNSKIGFQLEGKKCNGNTIEKNTLDNVSTPLLVEPKKDKEEMLKKNHILL